MGARNMQTSKYVGCPAEKMFNGTIQSWIAGLLIRCIYAHEVARSFVTSVQSL